SEYLPSDILKVGHHGSRTSTSQEFLEVVSPSTAVIQVGEDNRYGHPHEEVLNRLALAGVDIYRTDISGTIVITSNGIGYQVDTDPYFHEPVDPDPDQDPDPAPTRVNINTASFEELQEIVHIGEARAQEIINLRPFTSLDQLTQVTGIGPARLQDIKDEGIAYVE
ncbi:MAG: MBL fold metallo-hydrolase, partial [Tindallia sp. MSAO_Bac2]